MLHHRRKRASHCLDEPIEYSASPVCAGTRVLKLSTTSYYIHIKFWALLYSSLFFTDPQLSEKNAQPEFKDTATLPSTVGVRRCRPDRRGRRRSERVQEKRSLREGGSVAGLDALMASPISSCDKSPKQPKQGEELDFANYTDAEEFQHSTPETVQPKKSNQQRPSRKQAQQRPRNKPEAAGKQKTERGRKQERAPLKKPWENPKPRARSKSRDRSATRAKAALTSQGNKLNTSVGFNDTFDFDCEETVHVTPFRAKAEGNQSAAGISEETPQKGQTLVSQQNESMSSSSSESESSVYIPRKTRRRHTSPGETTTVVTTRRGWPPGVVRQKENIPPKEKISSEILSSPLYFNLFPLQ